VVSQFGRSDLPALQNPVGQAGLGRSVADLPWHAEAGSANAGVLGRKPPSALRPPKDFGPQADVGEQAGIWQSHPFGTCLTFLADRSQSSRSDLPKASLRDLRQMPIRPGYILRQETTKILFYLTFHAPKATFRSAQIIYACANPIC